VPRSCAGSSRARIEAELADAAWLGLNAVCDGRNVVLPAQATGLAAQLARDFIPVPVDLSSSRRGGAAKCCTLELRARHEHGKADCGGSCRGGALTAHNYHPLPVVITEGDGAWVTDVDGRRYLDCLAGYSALNFGHRHPALIDAARKQIEHVTLTSRAFLHDQFGPFCRELAELCGKDMVLPMNTGAEAVETAIKVSRKWGYKVKGVKDGQASIVVAANNFHGRTTTIISFSTDPDARADYGPYTPGFRIVPFGDLDAMRAAIDETTVAVLIEPIQGEAGVLVPPPGYLTGVRSLCSALNVLFVADEIQSGLGRTGDTFACDHEGVVPDMYVLGKALGGGVVPVSAVVANEDVLGVLRPGEHGSTFGGNPLACAVGIAVVELLKSGEYQERAKELGGLLHASLNDLVGHGVTAVRGRGLWAGVDIDPNLMTGRTACERLMAAGVLAKDTHGATIRLAPPLVVTEDDIRFAVSRLRKVLTTAT
jgi:ornithine--oxo-acid transaminase